jgi:hypothetical protein
MLCCRQPVRTAARGQPAARRRSKRAQLAVRAGALETGAEAVAGLVLLRLLTSGKAASTSRIETSPAEKAGLLTPLLRGVEAAPDALFGFQKRWVKLACSLVIDAVGYGSFLLPGLGESTDAGWAPISAILVQALYSSRLLSSLDFVKELLPFTDILPIASIGWCLEYTPAGVLTGWQRGKK